MSKAIRYARYGGPDVLSLDELPTPDPGPGQIRIVVRSAGVNPIDWKIRRGLFAQGKPLDEPAGTGIEVAGTIDAIGAGVEGWNLGQAVFGKVSPGALATHVLTTPEDILVKPDWLSFEQAGALPAAAETAYRTMRQLDLKAGQTLLIHAVAGGVGLVAAQLALAWGAKVIGTASPTRHAFLRELGVHPVTYGDEVGDRVRAAAPHGIDAVLDASGRDVLAVSVELTGSPAKVITIADGRADDHGVHFSSGAEQVPLAEVFHEVLPLLERGALHMPIQKIFPLERAADAHRLSEEGHVLGKIMINVA
jgi:acetyl esterase